MSTNIYVERLRFMKWEARLEFVTFTVYLYALTKRGARRKAEAYVGSL